MVGKLRLDFVALCEARERSLPMPKLILHALQVSIRGGELPTAGHNGRSYLTIPLDACPVRSGDNGTLMALDNQEGSLRS
jgi:hypothetical protein